MQCNSVCKEINECFADYIDGHEMRNQIREKMKQCFEGINVIGLPSLRIPKGKGVEYQYLNGRFKDGIAAISNTIINRLDNPRYSLKTPVQLIWRTIIMLKIFCF